MGSKRTLVLLAALVVGVVAAGALYFYVNGIENRAYKGTQPVVVWVVKQNIPAGTSCAAAQPAIGQKKVPLDVRPATAITDPSTIVGKVAKINLVAGQVVTSDMFAEQTDVLQSTFADRLGVGRVAVTVSVDQVHGVSGLLQPGDRVTMMVVLTGAEAGAASGNSTTTTTVQGQAPTQGADLGEIRFLYQNVEILAVGTNIGTSNPSGNTQVTAASSGLITFAVPADAAARIALVGAQLYLALEPKDYTPTSLDPYNWNNVFDTGGQLSPPIPTTTTIAVSTSTTAHG